MGHLPELLAQELHLNLDPTAARRTFQLHVACLQHGRRGGASTCRAVLRGSRVNLIRSTSPSRRRLRECALLALLALLARVEMLPECTGANLGPILLRLAGAHAEVVQKMAGASEQ